MAISEKKKGYLAAATYSCIIGFSLLAIKTSLQNASTPLLLAHRFTVAFLGALAVALARKINVRIRRRDFLAILPLSLFYPILYFLLQSMGLEYTTSSMAGILQSTTPVFAMIFSAAILKEKASGIQLSGVLLTVAGVTLLSLRGGTMGVGEQALSGPVLILLSSLAYGLFSVLSRRLSRRYPVFTITFWILTIGCVVFNLYALLASGKPGPAGILRPSGSPVMWLQFCIWAYWLPLCPLISPTIPWPGWRPPK